MKISVRDAIRYMGAGEGTPEIRDAAARIAKELETRIQPRYTWRAFRLDRTGEGILLAEAGKQLPGKLACSMLADCHTAVLMACTLGAVFDSMLRAREARNMAEAVMLDACGSAWAEAGCDAAEAEIAARFPGMYMTDRFSPGYGDLPLNSQAWILTVLDAGRRLGITVNSSSLLIPAKSVTAVIGLADKPQGARIRGCGVCRIRENCVYRERGTTCGIETAGTA